MLHYYSRQVILSLCLFVKPRNAAFTLCFFSGSRQGDRVHVQPSLFSRNNYHISLPCPAVPPSPRRFGLAAHPGSLDPVPQDERIPAHDRGVSHVYSCPIRVECMHETPAVARPPGKKLCSGRVLPGCRQNFAVLLYNLCSALPNLPLFLPEMSSRQQASTNHQFRQRQRR
jgi:hypothetical protein